MVTTFHQQDERIFIIRFKTELFRTEQNFSSTRNTSLELFILSSPGRRRDNLTHYKPNLIMLLVDFRSYFRFRFLGPKSSSSFLHSSHTVIVTLILFLLFQCPSFLEGKIKSNFIFFLFFLSLSFSLLPFSFTSFYFFHSFSSSLLNHVFIRKRKK